MLATITCAPTRGAKSWRRNIASCVRFIKTTGKKEHNKSPLKEPLLPRKGLFLEEFTFNIFPVIIFEDEFIYALIRKFNINAFKLGVAVFSPVD